MSGAAPGGGAQGGGQGGGRQGGLRDRGWLATLRQIERETPGPRIGRNARLAQEAVRLGQDPFLAFPAEDFTAPRHAAPGPAGLPRQLRTPLFGLFGPFGALPLTTTEEVARWLAAGDAAFTDFADIFAARFIQLHFRAWSDAHPISQHDRPEDDRFQVYVGAVAGVATPAFRQHDGLPDTARLPLVSLFGGRVRSPVRLRQMIAAHLDVAVRVEEHVTGWLDFEADDLSRLGARGALGRDAFLGSRLCSVNETIRLHVRTASLAQYRRMLPGAPGAIRLAEIVFWHLGKALDVEVALSLPADQVEGARLGVSASLGWMAALPRRAPPGDVPGDAPGAMVEAARFRLRLDTPNRPAT